MIPVLALAGAMVACDDDDTTYVWGEPDADDCMGVYFDADNGSDFILEPGGDCAVTLKMHRLLSTSAADVPLTLTSDIEGINMPSSVHFDAGESDAEIVVDFNNVPHKVMGHFSITVPDEYIRKYSLTYFNYESSILVSSWENANTDGSPVTFYLTETNHVSYPLDEIVPAVYQPVESEMQVLPGTGKIKITNFLNSGVEITFEMTPSEMESYAGYYRVYPYDNFCTYIDAYESDTYGDDWNNAWFLTDPNVPEGYSYSWDYASANLTLLDGTSSPLTYVSFYAYDNTNGYEFCYMAPKGTEYQAMPLTFNAVNMWISGTPTGSVTLPSYLYLYFKWDGESGL